MVIKLIGSTYLDKINTTEKSKEENYPCDTCCKSDVCGIQDTVRNSINQIRKLTKEEDPYIVVKTWCKVYLEAKGEIKTQLYGATDINLR